MKWRIRFSRIARAAGVACALAGAATGCSPVGLGMGHRLDVRHVSDSLRSASEFAPGTPVRVRTSSGLVVDGRLEAVERCSREEYETRYADWRQRRGGPWAAPVFGERIELIASGAPNRTLRFAGVAFDSLMGLDDGDRVVSRAPLAGVVAYRDSAGTEHRGEQLAWSDSRSGAPRYEQVRVTTTSASPIVHGEDIAAIRSGGSSRYMVAGFSLGLFLDLAALVLAARVLLPDN